MNEMQLTATLIALITIGLSAHIMRRRMVERRKLAAQDNAEHQDASSTTGRDESQWRRAYSRG